MHSRRRQAGFTLIEVIVAFFIFSLTAAAVYEVLFGALRRSLQSSDEVQAWLVAQSIRDEQSARPAPWPSLSDGEAPGGWRWSVSVLDREGEEFERAGLTAHDLTVEVWRRDRRRPLAVLRSVELSRRQ
jgi:prepilin-type N-terminal cleavage/methylation domain-containing protein